MASTMYAWSPIKSGKNDGNDKIEEVNVNPGESVTQDQLGVDDDGWRQLIESGSVRAMKYPDVPETFQGSPVEYLREQAKAAADGSLLDAETSEENIGAIALANAVSTGTALPPGVETSEGPTKDAAPPDGNK